MSNLIPVGGEITALSALVVQKSVDNDNLRNSFDRTTIPPFVEIIALSSFIGLSISSRPGSTPPPISQACFNVTRKC